jgi:hypothetical protein
MIFGFGWEMGITPTSKLLKLMRTLVARLSFQRIPPSPLLRQGRCSSLLWLGALVLVANVPNPTALKIGKLDNAPLAIFKKPKEVNRVRLKR